MVDYSIIIAAPDYRAQWPVLTGLREHGPDPARREIILALGRHPSLQRNRAIAAARGRTLVFLDSDCRVAPDYFARLEESLSALRADVLGGPVLLEEPSPPLQKILQAALSHPLAVGKTASRYASRGEPRRCGEAELILCNLAVSAEVFSREGDFHASLYPNEENEWLDRIEGRAAVWHDPQLVVRRPQRATWNQFLGTMVGYGAGRTRQLLVSRRFTAKSLPLVGLLAWLTLSFLDRALTGALTFFGCAVYITTIIATCPPNPALNWKDRLGVGLAALGTLVYYALGQLLGLVGWSTPRDAKTEVRLVNEQGEPLSPTTSPAG